MQLAFRKDGDMIGRLALETQISFYVTTSHTTILWYHTNYHPIFTATIPHHDGRHWYNYCLCW